MCSNITKFNLIGYEQEFDNKQVQTLRKEIVSTESNFEKFLELLKFCHVDFSNNSEVKLKEKSKYLDSLKVEADLNGRNKIYENIFYPLFKIFKLSIFKSTCSYRINKIKSQIEKEQDNIDILNSRIELLKNKNSSYEHIKEEINKKYNNAPSEHNLGDNYRNTTNFPSNGEKDPITELKLQISGLESNYVHLLKSLSKKILKPRDFLPKLEKTFPEKN